MSLDSYIAARDRLWRLPEELEAGSPLTDEAVQAAVAEFDGRLQTDCMSAAEGLFAAVAPLCALRPHLAISLLKHALLPLLYMGYDRAEQIQGFVDWMLSQPSLYQPLSVDGRLWLAEKFPAQAEKVQQALDELALEAEQDA